MNWKLILVRHSLPEVQQDLPAREWRLSKEGKARARRLAEILQSHGFDFIATSHEPKALETAQILADQFSLKPVMIPGLHEHERRSTPHLSQSDFEAAVRKFFDKPDILVLGEETADQAYQRFSGAVHFILSGNKDSKIAIVAHGTVISLFVSRLTGKPGFQIWSELGLPCFVVLDMQSKKLIAFENIS